MRLVERRDAWPPSSTLGSAAARAEQILCSYKSRSNSGFPRPAHAQLQKSHVQFSLGEKNDTFAHDKTDRIH
jgi:hypothetical protein